MHDGEPTRADLDRHRAVYSTPKLPAFSVREFDERLLAGRNPLTVVDVAELRRRGVTHVLDLREDHEWRSPGKFGVEAVDELRRVGLERRNVVIKDVTPPSPKALDEAVSWIEGALAQSATTVFVHCRAGQERTGTVLAAFLLSRGMSFTDALRLLKARCDAEPTPAQEAMVRAWAEGRQHGR
jgi:protein tyrosine phosphatase (PTP) superfamily phosphohydrolase (DUF442 family)